MVMEQDLRTAVLSSQIWSVLFKPKSCWLLVKHYSAGKCSLPARLDLSRWKLITMRTRFKHNIVIATEACTNAATECQQFVVRQGAHLTLMQMHLAHGPVKHSLPVSQLEGEGQTSALRYHHHQTQIRNLNMVSMHLALAAQFEVSSPKVDLL